MNVSRCLGGKDKMERLTLVDKPALKPSANRAKALIRLHAYENSGLTPERAAELAKAEQDGRMVQYVPGDVVYDRFEREWTVWSAEIRQFDGQLRYIYRCGRPDTNDYYALYADEIFTREEAEAALEEQKGG